MGERVGVLDLLDCEALARRGFQFHPVMDSQRGGHFKPQSERNRDVSNLTFREIAGFDVDSWGRDVAEKLFRGRGRWEGYPRDDSEVSVMRLRYRG